MSEIKESLFPRSFGYALSAVLLLVCVGIAWAAHPEILLKTAPYMDPDGDGIMNKNDDCPDVSGGDLQVSDKLYRGCPDADPDKDGFFVNIKGGIQIKDAKFVDQCPDKAGDDPEKPGCSAPTAEELALVAYDTFVKMCWDYGSGYYCGGGQAKFDALADKDRTDERAAKVAEAEQRHLIWRIDAGDSTPYEISAIEEQLARVTSEEERKRLRIEVDQELWVYYYVHCNEVTGKCDPESDEEGAKQMNRATAYAVASAFLPFEEAYPTPEDLVTALLGYYPKRALFAADEQKLTEDRLRPVFGLEREGFELGEDCDGKGRFYGEAARYGWFLAEAEQCARMYFNNMQFGTGVIFARRAGLSDWVVRIERAYVAESLDRGAYTPMENGTRLPEPIADHQDWLGSKK